MNIIQQRWLVPVLAVTIALSLIAGGCGKQEEAVMTTKGASVTVESVKRGDITNTITVSGKISAGTEIKVMPKNPGRVIQAMVELGQKVKAGQALVQLDTQDMNWKLRDAEADVASAQADLESITPQIAEKQANIKRTQADLNLQQINLERYRKLLASGAISQKEIDNQENMVSADSASIEATEQQIRALETMISVKRANIERKNITVANLGDQLRDMTIIAPVAAEVAVKNVEIGETASTSQPVVTLVDTAKMYMDANLSENDVSLISTGQKVNVVVDALGDNATIEGIVSNISPSADEKAKTFPVRISLSNGEGKLKAGMFGKVDLVTGHKVNIVVVPKEAVVERGTQKVVFTVVEDKAVAKAVTIGLNGELLTEIAAGINEGDRIIVSGQQNLQEGAPVIVQNNDDRAKS